MTKITGLCGWLGRTEGWQPSVILDAMTAVISDLPADRAATGPLAGLAAVGARTSRYSDDRLYVACVGHTRIEGDVGITDVGCATARRIAEIYLQHGVGALNHLHGAFALAIIERDTDAALLAIDRMGIETLCYANTPNGLVFATRADAVTVHPWVDGGIDPQAIFNYLFFHVVPAPGTIYRGVSKLLPGQFLSYRGGRIETGFYWEMRYADHPAAGERELARQFRELLPVVVARAASGVPRVGAFLSGGTDSTTVIGTLTQLTGSAVDAYSIGFDADGFDEMEYARIAARRFGARHHTYYVTPDDVANAVPLLASAYDEPFGNASAVPTYYCAQLAYADGIEQLLAGDGGDEIFGGNARYAKQKVFEAYGLIPAGLRAGLLEPLSRRATGVLGRIAPIRKLQSYIQQASIPLPDRLESYNFLVRSDLGEIFDADFLATIDASQPFALMREVYDRARSRATVNRMMHLDLKQTLADSDLRKVTTMCRMAGVDVAYPFLDEDMVDFSAIVPPEGKVKGLRLRHFFKEALKDFLPPEIISKTKHGFGLPFGVWLKEHARLREIAADSLNRFARRGYVRREYIDSLLDQHRSGNASYFGVLVWVIMMLELWQSNHEESVSLE